MTTRATRTVFSRQPARALLVDYCPPFDADTCEYIQEALADFFALVTHLSGPCRTPYFALFALGTYPESLFSLQHVRGNFTRLHSALDELKLFVRESQNIPRTPDVIFQGLQDVILQFKRQSQSLRQMSTSSCQLEITVMTCRPLSAINKQIERFTKTLDLESLKKIQVAAITNPDELSIVEEDNKSGSSLPDSSEESGGSLGCGLVDTITIEKDPLSLQNFFKTWLLDCGTDHEHIRIVLPSPFSPSPSQDEQNSLVLKCDLHERLIDPHTLPCHSYFVLQSHLPTSGNKTGAMTKPFGAASYPVYTLAASKLIKTEAICESLLFGMPHIVRPTLCWKLDWEELEGNQQYFYALCSILQEKSLVLLLKMQPNEALSRDQRCAPEGHFLLLPSDSGSLLLKSIAVNELVLPSDLQPRLEGASEETQQVMASCLDQIEACDSFNPLLFNSDLCKTLASQALKTVSSARPLKRRFQPPQLSQSQQVQLQASNKPRVVELSQDKQKDPASSNVRRLVFNAPRRPFAGGGGGCSRFSFSNKRGRSTSAAELYSCSPPDFPEGL